MLHDHLSEHLHDYHDYHDYKEGEVLFDRYRVEAIVGTGGMATVYRCADLRLGVDVAVKVLRREYRRSAEVLKRFLREAKIQAKLQHPHIVRVTNVEEHGENSLMVMELLRGLPLADYCAAKGPLSEAETLELMLPIVDALTCAHAADVVHRDVKPGNIFLAELGQLLVPKLMDFGVARQLDASMTTSTTLLGTLPYMSFEIVQSARNASPASDVYAAAATIFELLSGEHPLPARSLQEYVFAMMELVRVRPLRSARPEASPELEAVLARALAKDVEERTPSCAQFAEELRALPPGRAMAPHGPGPKKIEQSPAPVAPKTSGLPPTLTTVYRSEHIVRTSPLVRVFRVRDNHGQLLDLTVFEPRFVGDEVRRKRLFEAVEKQRIAAAQCPFIRPVERTHEAHTALAYLHSEGESLRASLDAYHRYRVAYALDLFVYVAGALQLAHEARLLHRLVCPEAIFLARHADGAVTPQLTDFSHTILLDRAQADLLGHALSYVAPELDGHPASATASSDIFALGVCLFETLTGSRPVHVSNLASWRQAFVGLSSLPDPRELDPSLPEVLCNIVGWCLALAPEARYQSVANVHRDLLAARKHLPGY